MLFLLFFILLGLGSFIFIQYRKHHKANELYNQAKELEKKDTISPYDITQLNKALKLYEQSIKLLNKLDFVYAAHQCQAKINKCLNFQKIVCIGKEEIRQKNFSEALRNFLAAKKLFVTEELEFEISKCQASIKQQKKILEQSIQIAIQGKFKEAINLLKPALDEFSCEDGQQLLNKLERVIRAKDLYKLGLIAEKKGEIRDATINYKQALDLLPAFTECKIRLAFIDVKNQKYNQVISSLEGIGISHLEEYLEQTKSYDLEEIDLEKIEGQQAAYIRGFAHAKLENWQQANREWKSINHDGINSQREILKSLAERDRLSQIKEIESAVDNNNIEIAKILSLEFIDKFGSEPTVQQNLENHIQPLLSRQIWETQDWQQIATKTEQIWLEQQNINSLHNWAVATYYQAQTNPNKLADFIIAWSTALANIEQNPALKNVPWLGSNSIDIKDVFAKLKQILENAIDAVKDDDIEEYLKLRDIYRREMVTLSLIQQNNCGMRIKQQLLILPSCYKRFHDRLSGIRFPAKVWGALYTDWGLAVAACHQGDIARAIKIKPSKNRSSEADDFAYCFVSYHEGCYYLQNLEWRKAVKPLQQAKSEIKARSDWRKEIDRLGELQRQKIKDFEEHLQFSQRWYELIATQPSRSYFAECKARKVAENLSNETISYQQGLKELQKIKDIDPNNSVTLNLIETIEIDLELQEIDRLWKQSQFEGAVRLAKRSRHEKVRFTVAEVCLEILLKGLQNGSLPFEVIRQLGNWAYELCPHEPAFRPLYSQLGIY